jgi:hypothetical protein
MDIDATGRREHVVFHFKEGIGRGIHEYHHKYSYLC